MFQDWRHFEAASIIEIIARSDPSDLLPSRWRRREVEGGWKGGGGAGEKSIEKFSTGTTMKFQCLQFDWIISDADSIHFHRKCRRA